MTLRNALIVYRKELVDSLRDRRTVISMVVIPIVMFPLLTVGMSYLTVHYLRQAGEEVPQVMILGGEDSPRLMAQLQQFKGIAIVPARPDYADEISDKTIRAAVGVPAGFDAALDRGGPAQVTIYNYEGEIKSELAAEILEKFFDQARDQAAKGALAAHNLPASLLEPITVEKKNVAPPEKVGGTIVGGFVPYFVIILCLTGAMYPAMDLTAGEKERGTMETILCSPVARTDLVMGKFFMVVTASLTTAILAITSMSLSFSYAKNFIPGLAEGADSPFHVTIGARGIFAVFAMVLPLSVLFSGVLLAISLFAKSFREAQSYVSPLTFVVIMPAIASILPGIELNARTALIPILNTSLVSKEIVSGTYHWGYIGLIFGTSCIYASIAIACAVRLFNREDVLFRA